MSVTVSSNVRKHAPVSGSEFNVLITLADIADEYGMCWPSIKYIARATRISERQAYRVIQRLEQDGHLEIIHRPGRSKTNFYKIRHFDEDEYSIRVDGDEEKKDVILAGFIKASEDQRKKQKGDMVSLKPDMVSEKGDMVSANTSITHQDPSGYSPAAVSEKESKIKTEVVEPLFEQWYLNYPRKIAKGAAEKAWQKLDPDETLSQVIITRTIEQNDRVFKHMDPKYIPHPATWLNARRWEDEIPEPRVKNMQGSDDWYDDFLNGEDDDRSDREFYNDAYYAAETDVIDAEFEEK